MKCTALNSLARCAVFLFTCACGSNGGDGGTGGVLGPNSLAGTWDIIGTEGTAMATGTLVIGAQSISLTYNNTTAAVSLIGDTGTGTWKETASSEGVSIARSGSAINTGAIPVGLGGSWTFTRASDSSDRCTATLSATSFTNSCSQARLRVKGIGGFSSTMIGSRTAQLSSVFGDLGGRWTFQSGDESCTVMFVDKTAEVQCGDDGWILVNVDADVASGTTDLGFEFSAQRRR